MMDYFVNFEVKTMVDLASEHNCAGEKLPDHSIVMCDVNLFEWDRTPRQSVKTVNPVPNNCLSHVNLCKRKVHRLPKDMDSLTSNERMINAINDAIDKISRTEHNQAEVNRDYKLLLDILTSELEASCTTKKPQKEWI